MKKITLFLASLLFSIGALAQITNVSEIDNKSTFTIKSESRGYLYFDYNADAIFSSSFKTLTNATPSGANNEQFAFLRGTDTPEGQYYLYSIDAQRFINTIDGSVGLALSKEASTLVALEKVDTYFVIKIANGSHQNEVINITNWQAINGCKVIGTQPDEGNKMTLVKRQSDADLTEGVFSIDTDLLSAAIGECGTTLDQWENKVGFPVVTDELETLYTTASETVNYANYKSLKDAMDAALESDNVNMPVSGKAYRIKAKYNDGSFRYLYRSNAGKLQVSTNEPEGYAGTFIFKQVEGNKYALVNNNGEYMVYYADGKSGVDNTRDGFADQYECGDYDAEITFIPAVNKTATNGTKDNWFAGFLMQARNVSDGGNFYMMAGDPDFHNAAANAIFYSGNNRSSIFYLEETEYPNQPTMNAITGTMITGEEFAGKNITTFSAPFATVIPEGVSAFYVESDNLNSTYAKVTKVNTAALPANQGFILVGPQRGLNAITMVPVTTEEVLVLNDGDNLLGHTAGASKAYDSSGKNYILSGQYVDGVMQVGFYLWNSQSLAMNKAYLKGGSSSSTNTMKIVWEGDVTDIEESVVTPAFNTNAPIYDLSGRRVLTTVKGGIYIQNGKKFIVK